MSFGRKGIAEGAAVSVPSNRGGFGVQPARKVQAASKAQTQDPHAAQREAFLAAERELSGGASQDNVGDMQAAIASEFARKSAPNMPSPMSLRMFGPIEKRSAFVAYLFWFILGQASLHRFYCGRSQSAWMQIGLIFGSVVLGIAISPYLYFGLIIWTIWLFVDLFLIPRMLREYKAGHLVKASIFS